MASQIDVITKLENPKKTSREIDGRGCKTEKLGTLAEMRRNGFPESKKEKEMILSKTLIIERWENETQKIVLL